MSLELVRRVRSTLYPGMDDKPLNDLVAAFQITAHVAYQLAKHDHDGGWGVIKAKSGSANNAAGFTSDIVARKNGDHWDCLSDTDGNAFPAWQYHEPYQAIRDRWQPSPIGYDLFAGSAPDPAPPPPPQPPDSGLQAALTQIANLTAVAEMHADMLHRQNEVLGSVATRLGLLVDRLKLPSNTSRSWAHGHQVTVLEKTF